MGLSSCNCIPVPGFRGSEGIKADEGIRRAVVDVDRIEGVGASRMSVFLLLSLILDALGIGMLGTCLCVVRMADYLLRRTVDDRLCRREGVRDLLSERRDAF